MAPQRNQKDESLTRRQFLKEVGATLGGATLASLALASGCAGSETTAPATSATSQPPTSTSLTGAPSSTTPQPTTGSTRPTTTAATMPPTSATTAPAITLLDVPGETVKVAADRLYSIEHIWVKAEGDQATIGISDKFQLLLEIISNLTLQPVGATIERYDSFGLIEGLKLTTELVMPVSGTILSVNPLMAEVSETNVGPLNLDPYGEGWMITIRLTNAAELNDLLTPEAYVTRIAKGQAEA